MYHKDMGVSGQGQVQTATSGRVNQKRRTRMAIVDAAQAILDRGEMPTVAAAAEEALVSRATAYRYFPTQESLLLELTVTVGLHDLEVFVAHPPDHMSVDGRVLAVLDRWNNQIFDNEALYRTTIRFYMDTWLAREQATDNEPPPFREGRRAQWLDKLLEPVRDTHDPKTLEHLRSALCLVTGGEAMTVMRDVCRLERGEALAVMHWAAETLLAAVFDSGDTTPENVEARRGP
jgi:AcrR family transcriptional regulator